MYITKTCPNCGYCPHCGRNAQPVQPFNPYQVPYTPIYPYTGPSWIGGNMGNAVGTFAFGNT